MSTVPATDEGNSDAELIARVRAGTIAAYGTLYERHVSAAYNLARQLSRSPAESDDLVAEAFAKVLDTLRAGRGPDSAFRAYLLTALRHTAYDKTRKDKRIDLNEDMSEVTGALGSALTVPFSDTAVAGLERSMAAKAFQRLPERWQLVLWHTEIEQQSPAEVAPLLGLTPNGVSALAYRAREGLRQAYLQVHLAETTERRCRATADKLGAWVRDGLSKRERAQVEAHLDECDKCRALVAELADVNGALRAVIAPLVLGGAVLGYLAAAGAAKASAATAVVAAGAAAGSGGAAAGAAAGAPRQFAGVAASGAAVAAAVAVGLAAGGGQQIPAAQPVSEPPAAAPEKPQPKPKPPPAPAEEPPPAPPPAPAPEKPAPAPADVTAGVPSGGITLTPGGPPVDVPISVTNSGGTKSAPVTVTLSLPDGVSAVEPGGGGGAPMAAAAPAARAAAAPHERVQCPGGSGKVSCSTSDGLEPDESATLVFRLVAAEGAHPGTITGTVSTGGTVTVTVRIPVETPQPADSVALHVHATAPHLKISVENTGDTTKRLTLIVDRDLVGYVSDHEFDCTGDETTTCVSAEPIKPGEVVWFKSIIHRWVDGGNVTVTAKLGSASDSETVPVTCVPEGCSWPMQSPPSSWRPAPERSGAAGSRSGTETYSVAPEVATSDISSTVTSDVADVFWL